MKRSFAVLALALATTFPLAAQLEPLTPSNPAPAVPAGSPAEDVATAYFVELRGAPTADGGSPAAVAAEKKAFKDAARKNGVRHKERFAYGKLWNGFSLELAPGDVAKVARMPEVKAVYPVAEVRPPAIEVGSEQDLSTALVMTQADIVQNQLGLTGRGIRIGIMDSGIDYDHPDLGGCFGPGCKVVSGWDFVGDAYNNDSTAASYNPVPTPDPFPDDCGGHGTHVAGIAAANGRVRGVAPEATLRAYRVFGCEGSTFADIMVAAMELALEEGVDVFNISIGAAFQWPDYPTAKAADRMARKGVVVVTSAGNSGANGLYSLGAPSVGEKVISVASFTNTALKIPSFLVSPDDLQVGYDDATGSPAPPASGSFPLARTGTPESTADGCNTTPLAAGSLTGKIVLIRRGTCGFHEKALNAQNAGAAGVLIYNNTTGLQNITVEGVPAITIPVVSITAADGVTLDSRIAAGTTTLTWSDLMYPSPIATANLIAGSSSIGLSPNLTLKPDLGAPGAGIYSTYPLEQGGYANLSGTSMASPHVAGAAALLLQARPKTPPQAVLALLQNSASPRLWSGNPALGHLEVVHRQGAGMIQLADAIASTAKVEPAKLSLGESEAGPALRTLTVENNGAQDVTYTLSHAPALATGPNTFVPAYFAGFATVAFSAPAVTVPAGGTASFTVTITANPGLQDGSLYGGYLVLTPQGDSPALRVPYAGFKGDYQAIEVLKPTPSNFPWLAKLDGTSLVNQPGGATYTMAGTDLPRVLVHFDHQLRRYRLEVFDADTGRAWHRALEQEWVGRNSGATSFFTLTWDGTTRNGNKVNTVPNGRYILKLTVVKALGDDDNPAHVETWTSPVVTVAR